MTFLNIRMSIAIAWSTTIWQSRISVASNHAGFAMRSFCIVVTFVTASNPGLALRVVIATTIYRAVDSGPTKITNAREVGRV